MRAPSAGARIVALLGLVVVCCIAAIICTVERVGQQREVLLQKGRRHARGRRSVAALDGNVFASPQDIYKQALDRFKRAEKSAISGDDALAWAHPSWKHAATGIVGGVKHATDLESKIAKDVTSQLAGDISAVVAREVRAALKGQKARVAQQQRVEEQSAKQQRLARAVQRKIAQDQAALAGDKKLAAWLKRGGGAKAAAAAGIEKGSQLAADFDRPVDVQLPPMADAAHAQQGGEPVVVKGAPEHDGLTARGVNVGSVSMDAPEPEEDNRAPLEARGVKVTSSEPRWAGRASDAALRRAGVVTDRLPLLGQHYGAGIPLPGYHDHTARADEASAALEEGHRPVSERARRLQDVYGVKIAGPNMARYSTEFSAGTRPSDKMDARQRAYPYMDGLGDHMQDRAAAERHDPLAFWMHAPKKGSKRLEGAGVNVWGAPLSLQVPSNFLAPAGAPDAGAQALAKAGVVVDRPDVLPPAPVPRAA
jgi:hypothetical protein